MERDDGTITKKHSDGAFLITSGGNGRKERFSSNQIVMIPKGRAKEWQKVSMSVAGV